jgi:hypothetical protein
VNEFEALEQAYQRECFKLDALAIAIREIEAQGIARDTVVALEEYCPELVTADYPLASYTRFPSETNLGFAMEGLVGRMLKSASIAIMKLIDLWVKITRWISDKLRELIEAFLRSDMPAKLKEWYDRVIAAWKKMQAEGTNNTYNRVAGSLLCQWVEDSSNDLYTNDQLYGVLNEMNEISLEIVKAMRVQTDALVDELTRSGNPRMDLYVQNLYDDTDDAYNSLWLSPLNEMCESIDRYHKGAPTQVPTVDLALQTHAQRDIGYTTPPILLDVLQARIDLTNYFRDNDRTESATISGLERMYKAGLFEAEDTSRPQRAYAATVSTVEREMEKVSKGIQKATDAAVKVNYSGALPDYIDVVRGGLSTLMRFGKAMQQSLVLQSRVNEGRGTIVRALNMVLDEAESNKK